jgi:hypothetical protein
MKRTVLSIFAVFLWISGTLFLRNEILLKEYWINHYDQMGLVFPSEPINGIVWVIWSLLFAVAIIIFSKKFSLINTALISWLTGFVLVEIVVGNMGVLPFGILVYAIPMSLVEVFVAAFLGKKITEKK